MELRVLEYYLMVAREENLHWQRGDEKHGSAGRLDDWFS